MKSKYSITNFSCCAVGSEHAACSDPTAQHESRLIQISSMRSLHIQIKQMSAMLFIISDRQVDAAQERIHIQDNSSLTNHSIICDTEAGAAGSEFQVLIKEGAVITSKY